MPAAAQNARRYFIQIAQRLKEQDAQNPHACALNDRSIRRKKPRERISEQDNRKKRNRTAKQRQAQTQPQNAPASPEFPGGVVLTGNSRRRLTERGNDVIGNVFKIHGYIDELRIIDVSTFSKAQEIMRQRTLPHGNVPLNCKGKSLLVGNIFCAHCGNRLTLTTSGRRVYRADGTVKYEPRMRYQCHYNVRHPGECDGQSGYGVTKLDGIVEKVIRMKFAEIAAAPESEILNHQHKKEIELARIKLDQANAHLAEKQKDLSDYKAETLKVIRGQSNLSVELLNALVKETETMIALAQTRIDAAQTEYDSLLASAENLRQEYDRLLTWADLFDTCSFEAKKMIVAQFVKAVRISRDYNIEIDFNVSFEEFQNFSVKNGEPVILQPPRSHTA